ncbi:tail fiber assembly protein [Microcystis sp. M061S2]|uniref:tail fiber assembly protein n=1 Tax=Microcystis sp. M061S2 TaxID=2771171 RepID=UPI00338E2000
MTLYSYNGGVPAPLPDRHRLPNRLTRTDLVSLTVEQLAALGFVPTGPRPAAATTKVVEWEGEWIVRSMTETEIANARNLALASLRSERDKRLIASDFRVLPDAPWDTAPWAVYRQALRDLPEQTADPLNPVWPQEPA